MDKITSFFIAGPENNYRPPVLSYKAFVIYGLVLLLLRLLLGSLQAKGSAVDSTTLMQLINEERTNRNIGALNTNADLLVAAQGKSQDMLNRGYFAHVDPDGNYVWDRIVATGYTPYKILGENLAIDFSTSEGMVQAWINSPTHRANLLNTEFQDQGLSALYGNFQNRYTDLATSLFGTLSKAQAAPAQTAPAIKPQPKPTTLSPTQTPKQSPSKPTPPPPAPAPPLIASSPTTLPTKPETTSATTTQSPFTAPGTISNPSASASQFFKTEFSPIGRYASAFETSRVIFTLFGILILIILSFDSVIVYQHDVAFNRSHPSYHLFGFVFIILVSVLIWWW